MHLVDSLIGCLSRNDKCKEGRKEAFLLSFLIDCPPNLNLLLIRRVQNVGLTLSLKPFQIPYR